MQFLRFQPITLKLEILEVGSVLMSLPGVLDKASILRTSDLDLMVQLLRINTYLLSDGTSNFSEAHNIFDCLQTEIRWVLVIMTDFMELYPFSNKCM